MKIKKKIEKIDCSNFIKQYLKSCGIDDVDLYLNPNIQCFNNPFDYQNMEKAIKVFDKHIKKKNNIGILIDSDMDGSCSASIIYQLCVEQGAIPKIYFHSGKQHGIHDKLNEIIKDNLSLLIVPDAGTNDVEDCKTSN